MDLYPGKAIGVQCGTEFLYKIIVYAFFIAATYGIEVKAILIFQPFYPFNIIVAHVLRPEIIVTNPAWSTPSIGIKGNSLISFFSFLHNPPFVAAAIIFVVARMHVRWF